jgi:chitobiase/beta-hexosaminidase-like protein
MLAFRPVTSLVGITSTFFERNTMPDGLVRTGDFRQGSPITLPHDFGNDVTWQVPNPEHFGNPVNEPVNFGNPVTWQPTPSHFGNVITPATTLLATPVATPTGGSYTGAQSVTLTTDPNATATYYTTDGSTPTTGSTLYTGAITTVGSGTEVIKAFSHGTGSYSDSAVLTATYVITPVVVVPQLQAHTYETALGGFYPDPVVTSPIDTSLANFLVVYVQQYIAATMAVTDTIGGNPSGNVWQQLTAGTQGHSGCIFYCYNANVGADHVFSAYTSAGFGVSCIVEAWSGIQSSSDPLRAGSDQVDNSVGIPITGLSETPTDTNDLVIMGVAQNVAPVATYLIDTGFTISDSGNATGGSGVGGALAYLIAPNTTPVEPTWTVAAGGSTASLNGAVFAHA